MGAAEGWDASVARRREGKRGEERRRLQGMWEMRRGGTRAVEVPRS